MDIHNKHYIRIDAYSRIVYGFSDAFEQPADSDICINEQGGRHFELFGEINPPLYSEFCVPLYKWSKSKVVKRSDTEIQADIDALPKPEQPDDLGRIIKEQTEKIELLTGCIMELTEMVLGGDE